MADASRKGSKARTYEVLVSFSGLDKGERFTAADADHQAWAETCARSGYLEDVTGESTAEEAQNAGDVGQG